MKEARTELFNLASGYNEKKMYLSAKHILEQAKVLEIKDEPLIEQYIFSLFYGGFFSLCDSAIVSLLEINPLNSFAASLKSKFDRDEERYNHLNNNLSGRYYFRHIELGNSLLVDKRYFEAVEAFKIAESYKLNDDDCCKGLAKAYYGLEDFDQCILYCDKSLSYASSIDISLIKSNALNILGRLDDAYLTLRDAYEIFVSDLSIFLALSEVMFRTGRLDEIEKSADEILSLNPRSGHALFIKAKRELKLNRLATAISLVELAIQCFNDGFGSSSLKSENLAACFSVMAECFERQGDIQKTISNHNLVLKHSSQVYYYYNRGLFYYKSCFTSDGAIAVEYLRCASADFDRVVELDLAQNGRILLLSKVFAVELRRYEADRDLFRVAQLSSRIRHALAIEDISLLHFTSLSAGKAMIFDKSPFRLSEGTYMNDSSEGSEIYRMLPLLQSGHTNLAAVVGKQFIPKWFIGSFVKDDGFDDLTLWRMYGKEGMQEGRGCAIKFNSKDVLQWFNDYFFDNGTTLQNDMVSNPSENFDSGFMFFRVAYLKKGNDLECYVSDFQEVQMEAFLRLLRQLREEVTAFYNSHLNDNARIFHLQELLGELKYLFKSDDYRHEREVRLTIKGRAFEKHLDFQSEPPRVYIKTFEVIPFIKQLILGPKVVGADEWASAFYYQLRNSKSDAVVSTSALPFK